jgi:uncharacterized protein YutE (UPF0331/DUF86 family)
MMNGLRSSARISITNEVFAVTDDILLNKAAIIERCLRRISEEHDACPQLNNYTHLDAMILNLERACQATIDMAMHIVARRRLGIPQGSADAFTLLCRGGVIDQDLSTRLIGMVGFRNVAVHEYQGLDLVRVHKDIGQPLVINLTGLHWRKSHPSAQQEIIIWGKQLRHQFRMDRPQRPHAGKSLQVQCRHALLLFITQSFRLIPEGITSGHPQFQLAFLLIKMFDRELFVEIHH